MDTNTDPARNDQNAEDDSVEQSNKPTRLYILGFFWAVIILAVPFWWNATSIERLSIPEGRVRSLEGRKVSRIRPVRGLGRHANSPLDDSSYFRSILRLMRPSGLLSLRKSYRAL